MAYVTEQTRAALAAASPGWASLRRRWLRFAGQLPVVPLAILVPFVLVAVFANAIAPFETDGRNHPGYICDPPVAIARLGGSTTPVVAYTWRPSPDPRSEGDTVI